MTTVDDSVRPGEASSRMLQMLNAFLTVQALHVVATLGIPDRLADGPAAVDELAVATGGHAPSLHRLLRLLVGAGVFHEEANGHFALGPLGRTLCSQGPDSV